MSLLIAYDSFVLEVSATPSAVKQSHLKIRPWTIYTFVLLASAQIALSLSSTWNSQLTALTVADLALSTLLFARLTYKAEKTAQTFFLIAIGSFAVEVIGVHTGWPFGRYSYTDGLGPRVASVPLLIPLAWYAVGLPAWSLARRITGRRWAVALIGGYLLAAYDLFLDPQMTHNGFWVWHTAGWWQGIPFTNYVGWFVVGTVMTGLVDRVMNTDRLSDGLSFNYSYMSFMSTLGFLLPIGFDRPIVGLVGGVFSLPFVAFAWYRKGLSWRA